MNNHFRAGFGDELIKQAFIGGALRAIARGASRAARGTGNAAKSLVKKQKTFDPTKKKQLDRHLKELKKIQSNPKPKRITPPNTPLKPRPALTNSQLATKKARLQREAQAASSRYAARDPMTKLQRFKP